MSLHHLLIESKEIDVKQIEIIKNNTTIIYSLMNILRDKLIMSTLSLRSDENSFMRSTRVHHSTFDDDDDEFENNENDENDNDDEKTNDTHRLIAVSRLIIANRITSRIE